MILYDFSSCIHRAVFTAIKHTNPHKLNGKYKTDEFISTAIFRIIQELVDFYKNNHYQYNDFVICLDNHSKPYWRKEIYPYYKANRKKGREESEVDYNEVFKHTDILIKVLKDYTNFKVIGVPGVEADDIIGLLTRKYAKFEKILILSPDKDFKQLHSLGQIRQYSSITNKWIIPDDVEGWKIEHVCLGDGTDNVPRIVDFVNFTEDFKSYLRDNDLNLTELEMWELPWDKKVEIFEDFKSRTNSRVYLKPKFGPASLKKTIENFGSLDKFLDSNPIIRGTYEMNRKLVLDDEVPAKIEVEILKEYTAPKGEIDLQALKKYFGFYDLQTCVQLFSDLSFATSKPVDWNSKFVDFDLIA